MVTFGFEYRVKVSVQVEFIIRVKMRVRFDVSVWFGV